MSYSIIPSTAVVDNVTIGKNPAGEIQIKGGALTLDMMAGAYEYDTTNEYLEVVGATFLQGSSSAYEVVYTKTLGRSNLNNNTIRMSYEYYGTSGTSVYNYDFIILLNGVEVDRFSFTNTSGGNPYVWRTRNFDLPNVSSGDVFSIALESSLGNARIRNVKINGNTATIPKFTLED